MQENSTTTASNFLSLIRRKNVVYITVKNQDYIRTSQIKRLLEKEASSWHIYSSDKRNPMSRALDLRRRLGKNSIDFNDVDVVILGFLPQLIMDKVVKELTRAKENQTPSGKDDSERNPVIVAEMFLSMYDTVISDRHLFRDGGMISRWMYHLDDKAIKAADLVITDTRANADYLSYLYHTDRSQFETLYLEADEGIYTYKSDKPAESDQQKNYKEVLYFGTGLPLQGTDVILNAFNIVAGRNNKKNRSEESLHISTQVKCTFIGSTRGIPKFSVSAARSNPDIELIKWLPQQKLAQKILQADICIAGHFNPYIDKADRTIPGKAYIYEAMNKKMILGDTAANHELFVEDDRHFMVKRGNAGELADVINKALSAD